MSTTTITESLEGSSALYVDCRNAVFPFTQDTLQFAKRFTGGTDTSVDDYLTADSSVIFDLDGITEVITVHILHDVNGTFTVVAPSSIVYTTTAGAKKATITVPNSSSTALHLFAICKI